MKQKLTNAEIEGLSDAALGKLLDEILDFDGKESFRFVSYIDLCCFLDEVAKVEQIVIGKVGKYEYGEALINRMGMSGSHLSGITSNGIAEIAMASSRERAEACLMALQGEI